MFCLPPQYYQLIGEYGHGQFGCVHPHHGDLILLRFNVVNFTIGYIKVTHDLDDIHIVEPDQLIFYQFQVYWLDCVGQLVLL